MWIALALFSGVVIIANAVSIVVALLRSPRGESPASAPNLLPKTVPTVETLLFTRSSSSADSTSTSTQLYDSTVGQGAIDATIYCISGESWSSLLDHFGLFRKKNISPCQLEG